MFNTKDIKNEVRKLLQAFKNEFINTKESFDDKRPIRFEKLNYDNTHYFCTNQHKERIEKKGRMEGTIVQVEYFNSSIDVYRNYERFNDILLDFPHFRISENFVREIVYHEYGHSFLVRSVYDTYKPEIQRFLDSLNIESIFFVPKNKMNELREVLLKSSSDELDISTGLMIMLMVEYFADYSVRMKIKKEQPIGMNRNKMALKKIIPDTIKNFYKMEKVTKKKLANNILHIAIITQKFHIYNKWNEIEGIFKENNLYELFRFCHFLNTIFKEIIQAHSDYRAILCEIYKVSEILDQINYYDLVFNNIGLSQEVLLQFKEYIRSLKNT